MASPAFGAKLHSMSVLHCCARPILPPLHVIGNDVPRAGIDSSGKGDGESQT